MELAYVEQGYAGANMAGAADAHSIHLQVVKHS